jgi:hypothetical protein
MFTIPTKRAKQPDFAIVEESHATSDGFNAKISGPWNASQSSRAS